MAREYYIGKLHPETIKIPEKHNAVSREHARITIQDNGEWILEDLGSTNGTYIVEPGGKLMKISRLRITPSTKIQLGPPTVNGFQFPAALITDDLTPAWNALQQNLYLLREDEARFKSRAKTLGWVQKCSVGLAMILLMVIFMLIGNQDKSLELNLNRLVMIVAPVAVGFIVDRMLSGREELAKRRGELRCPNPQCNRPLPEHDIEYGACPFCKCYKKN